MSKEAFPDIYDGNDVAIKILEKRYLHRDMEGKIVETPRDRFIAVAKCVASGDLRFMAGVGEVPFDTDPIKARLSPQDLERLATIEQVFYRIMASREFLPNTPCLANAGWPDSTMQMSACFVLPVEDDMEDIFDTLKKMAMIQKSGGGTGFDFSKLRPDGDFVRSTTGIASGPISFMRAFNNSTEVIKQSGIRRGANMGILRVDHPDILEFIDCKRVACEVCADLLGRQSCDHSIRNFNISVAITNKFMMALANDEEYNLYNPHTGLSTRKLKARLVWDKIVHNAWFSGEPGLFFVDRANEHDPLVEALGPIAATNPCGEVPLRSYDACTLGSINLERFYAEKPDGTPTIDFKRLEGVVRHAVHFLDNVLIMNRYPRSVPEIAKMTGDCRKIGLGVMGWHDLLIRCRIPYASEQALSLAEQVMAFINSTAVQASQQLAQERGPFPLWDKSAWHKKGHKPRRNATTTVIAPTGSISAIACCWGGIEPLAFLAIKRNQAGMEMFEINPAFVARGKKEGWYTPEVEAHVTKHGRANHPNVPEEVQELFKISTEIPVDWHIRMQAAFQRHVEDAVSKTNILHEHADKKAVEDSYMLAWNLGCKGITVYRDKSRGKQVYSAGSGAIKKTLTPEEDAALVAAAEAPPPAPVKLEMRDLKSVPVVDGVRMRHGVTLSVPSPFGTVHVIINRHPKDGKPFECFVSLGKSGTETLAVTEAIGRTVTMALANPSTLLTPHDILRMLAEQYKGIGGGQQAGFGADKTVSAPDAVSKAIVFYLKNADAIEVTANAVLSAVKAELGAAPQAAGSPDICPECHQGTLYPVSGCDKCTSCGYSSC